MFKQSVEYIKNKWLELTTTKYEFTDPEPLVPEDYWAFEMRTGEWVDELGDTHPTLHSVIVEPDELTWMGTLDKILDVMGKHYGYNIKEQVYYSVQFPLNVVDRDGKPYPGYSRNLNDELLQQVLLAHPELYHSYMFGKPTQDLFA